MDQPLRRARPRSGDGWIFSILTFLILVALGGCHPRPPVLPLPAGESSPNAIYEALLARAEKIRSLKGVATLRLRSSARNTRLEAVIVCSRPGRLRVEGLDFLGHVVYLGILRENELISYFASENRLLQQPATPELLEENVGIPLEASAVIELVLGSPFFVELKSPELEMGRLEDKLALKVTQADQGIQYEVAVDPWMRPLECLFRRDPGPSAGPAIFRAEFKEYRRVGDLDFPFLIRLSDSGSGALFSIRYQEVVMNPALGDELFRFSPPADAEEEK